MDQQQGMVVLPFDVLKAKAEAEVMHWTDAAARYSTVASQAAAEGRPDAGDMAEAVKTAQAQLRHAQEWLAVLEATEPDSLPAPGVQEVQ